MKNWKTTAAGWGIGALYLFLGSLQGGLKPKDAAMAAGLGMIGSLAKDFNVTGGKVLQDPLDPATNRTAAAVEKSLDSTR